MRFAFDVSEDAVLQLFPEGILWKSLMHEVCFRRFRGCSFATFSRRNTVEIFDAFVSIIGVHRIGLGIYNPIAGLF